MTSSRMHAVQSGIGLVDLSLDAQDKPAAPAASFITSRTARVLLAGIGFLADAYDLFVINLVLKLLKEEYPQFNNQVHKLEGLVASAALFGSIVGQLVAGSLADIIGRKKIFVATAVLISIGSIGSSLSLNFSGHMNIYYQISFWRFFLGAGVGGEYPLAATVTSESSSAGKRGALMAAVFSMQGVGAILSVLVIITCLTSGASNGFTWRFALAFGALPALLAFPWRLRMHETETFERVKKERADNSNHHQQQQKGRHSLHSASADGTGNRERADTWGSQVSLDSSVDYGALQMTPISTNNNNSSSSSSSGSKKAGYSAVQQSDNDELPQHQQPATKNPLRGTHSRSGIDISELDNLDSTHTPTGDHPHDSSSITATAASHGDQLSKAFTYYKWHMFGTALSWFLLDVNFYANNLFSKDITQAIMGSTNSDGSAAAVTPLSSAEDSLLLLLVAIPGYVLSVRYIDTVGRKQIQLMGFCATAVFFLVCTLAYDSLLLPPPGASFYEARKWVYLLLYSMTFLFSNFGPNTTSFVIPGEIYPSEVRATCHGLSAAAGKLGAATGAFFFPIVSGAKDSAEPSPEGIKLCMFICACVSVLGAVVTFFFIPYYSARDLVYEGKYHPLPHQCLRPSTELLHALGDRYYEADDAAAAGEEQEEMVLIIERCDNYELPEAPLSVSGGAGVTSVSVAGFREY